MTVEIAMWNSSLPAVIDDGDAELLRFKWRLNERGYAIRHCEIRVAGRIVRKMKLAHAVLGFPPSGMVVDHINRDRLDNRKDNLRMIPANKNAQNCNARSNNITGLRGSMLRKDTGKYLAHVRLNGVNIRLGYYETAIEAAEIAKRYRLKHMPYTVES